MKKLAVYDFDGTLVNSPTPDIGKQKWSEYYKQPYPYQGWWSRKESLDLNVFDFNIFPTIVGKIRDDYIDSQTFVMILTARLESLRPQVEAILKAKNIPYNALEMNPNGATNRKGDVIMHYYEKFPELEEIDVYDDMQNKLSKLEEYTEIRDNLPDTIDYKIYHVQDGSFYLVDEFGHNKLGQLVSEEIIKFFKKYL